MLLRVLDDKKFLKFDEPSWVLTVGGGASSTSVQFGMGTFAVC